MEVTQLEQINTTLQKGPVFLKVGAEWCGECIYGDPIHLEQALINLIKNALEANAGAAEPVVFRVRERDGHCEFEIADAGPGIANPGNLFVPFYTTKTEGAGIGLVLSRNIVAKHHGQLTLENRGGRAGAVARMTLPLPPSEA